MVLRLPRRRKVLTLMQKHQIIIRRDAGESRYTIANEYNFGCSNVADFEKNRNSIMLMKDHMSEKKFCTKKVSRSSKFPILEDVLSKWFAQKRANNEPINGIILQSKAHQLKNVICPTSKFVASQGWLRNFRRRYNIRRASLYGERLSADKESAEIFKEKFSKISNRYNPNYIFNADETGLYFKNLDNISFITNDEDNSSFYKKNKERLTLLVCPNLTGTIRIPILVIGRSKNPRCFRNKNLPSYYASQNSIWMTKNIFFDWFNNCFMRSILEIQRNRNENYDVALFLDNAGSHPSSEELNRFHTKCKVFFFPPNTTSLIQPMDQGVIERLKRGYKMAFHKNMIFRDGQISIPDFIKKFTVYDAIVSISSIWNEISAEVLRNSWNPLTKKRQNNEENGIIFLYLGINEQSTSTESYEDELLIEMATARELSQVTDFSSQITTLDVSINNFKIYLGATFQESGESLIEDVNSQNNNSSATITK